MRVSDLGHPGEFLDLFGGRDFELYGHQEEAIEDFRSGHNVLLSVPTAAGKTLVAYSAILDTFARGMKSIYIVPLKALASEKFDEMKRLRSLGMRVSISVGDYDSPPSVIRENDVVVMTGEKADSFLHHDPDVFQDVGLIVADEVHLIGERKRGPVLENVLTGARLVNPDLRVVALSATVSNYGEIAKWLGARSVVSDFRPVKLRRGIYYRGRIIYDDQSIENLPKGNDLWGLVWKFVSGGGQVLIFVNSRRRAEETARVLADASSRETEIDEDYDDDGMYQEDLFDLMRKGVAYHHAGLSLEQRALIEKMFRERQLDVIVATPTLAAGVNLPARAVIVRDTTRFTDGHTEYIPSIEVQQMLGRAGRPGYDTQGYAIIFATTPAGYDRARAYLTGETEPVVSSFGDPERVRFNCLALVSSRLANTLEKIEAYYSSTLYSLQSGIERVRPIIPAALDFLEREGFIREWDDGYRPTQFGKEVSDLYIDPESAVVLREYLAGTTSVDRALLAISLTRDMQTLRYFESEVDTLWSFLEECSYRSYDDTALKAAKTALVLRDWIEEVPMRQICNTYAIGPGDVQSCASSAEWMAYSLWKLSTIIKRESAHEHQVLYRRISEGVREDILALTVIRGVGRVRARRLKMAGLDTVEKVASAGIDKIATIPGFSTRLAADTIRNASIILRRMGT